MPLVVNSNISALNTQRNLNRSQGDLSTSLQRLSSGLRINSAKDDAAGLAISDRMTAQIRGLNQAVRNANDGISIAQVTEGALGEVTNSLQRMRELAVQSANDTNSGADRASLQKEVAQLKQEIDRIATQTQFNGKNLLDGSFSSGNFQVGAYAGQTISFGISSSKTDAIGAKQASSAANIGTLAAATDLSGSNGVSAGTLTVASDLTTGTAVAVTAGDSAKTIAASINAVSGQTGVNATATTEVTLSALAGAGVNAGVADKLTFTLQGTSITVGDGAAAVTMSQIATAINTNSGTTGVTATYDATAGTVKLTAADGSDIKIGDITDDDASGTGTAASIAVGGQTLTSGASDSIIVGGKLTFSSSGDFTVAPTTTNVLSSTATGTLSSSTSVSAVDISSQAGSTTALNIIDGALSFVDNLRANLGAVQNRFSSVVASGQATAENVSAARSRVQDADFAAETANLSRAQILQQAGTAMLAQANQQSQGVLSLLR